MVLHDKTVTAFDDEPPAPAVVGAAGFEPPQPTAATPESTSAATSTPKFSVLFPINICFLRAARRRCIVESYVLASPVPENRFGHRGAIPCSARHSALAAGRCDPRHM
jgi:hypothetical protein